MTRLGAGLGALAALLIAGRSPLAAQQWNAPEARALVARAAERRAETQADTILRSYRTRAHGFVFFLVQIGEGLAGPPRLAKADELEVEVYWQAPDRGKQIVRAWRDTTFLPADINYHRDHLGIVTNNFGDRIRIGEGDEVRDAVHPLSPEGLESYDFALGDSLAIRSPRGEVRVQEVLVRPRSSARPLVVGRLYLDRATAEIVRFRFSFTPAAYLDRRLEDISVSLENSLREGRYWLPFRQEIEIRRRVSWLDFPVRGIIRGRWEIEDYDLGAPVPPEVWAGPAIGGLLRPGGPDSVWREPLGPAIAGAAPPLAEREMEAVRAEVERVVGERGLSGLPAARLAFGSVSDLIHVNRVQGLALGAGATFGLAGGRLRLGPRLGLGTSDGRVTGGLRVGVDLAAAALELFGSRRVRDLSDFPVISPALNSLLSQEAGDDYGDYLLLDAAGAGVRLRTGARGAAGVELAVERPHSLEVVATPARGTYRPNPPLGAGTYRAARLRLERTASGAPGSGGDLSGALGVELGDGPTSYLRLAFDGRWIAPLGRTRLLFSGRAGWGTAGLPAYRSFVLGGRGTLVGEPFRAYGGRSFALGRLEWRVDLPVPSLRLGSFVSTGPTVTLAPFVAAGWSDRPYAGLPWGATDGVRPVAGVALELFYRLLRLEAGYGLRTGHLGLTVDVHPDWWGVL